jgi:hypothetical protein
MDLLYTISLVCRYIWRSLFDSNFRRMDVWFSQNYYREYTILKALDLFDIMKETDAVELKQVKGALGMPFILLVKRDGSETGAISICSCCQELGIMNH